MFLVYFVGFTEVTKEIANEYLGECHALCFIENRKGIPQIYPKIEEFV